MRLTDEIPSYRADGLEVMGRDSLNDWLCV